ncbi:MAG: sigma-70 family RNA polymerase sigma factor [Ichthyobacteriaceae bacterium]|nr:sigma-70 family RNA polymerase sigma factor [Ichthyobacteriaceae bacterium]
MPKTNPEMWLHKYGDYLYSYAISRLKLPELAEDVLQETFLSAMKSKDNFKEKSNEKTWLTSILKRKIIDLYRKKYKNIETSMDAKSMFVQDKFMYGSWNAEDAPQDWGVAQGEDWIGDEEFIKVLDKCILNLPDKWRFVFMMKHQEEASNSSINKKLGVSESNIWTILHRARLQLRECIESLWFKTLS